MVRLAAEAADFPVRPERAIVHLSNWGIRAYVRMRTIPVGKPNSLGRCLFLYWGRKHGAAGWMAVQCLKDPAACQRVHRLSDHGLQLV